MQQVDAGPRHKEGAPCGDGRHARSGRPPEGWPPNVEKVCRGRRLRCRARSGAIRADSLNSRSIRIGFRRFRRRHRQLGPYRSIGLPAAHHAGSPGRRLSGPLSGRSRAAFQSAPAGLSLAAAGFWPPAAAGTKGRKAGIVAPWHKSLWQRGRHSANPAHGNAPRAMRRNIAFFRTARSPRFAHHHQAQLGHVLDRVAHALAPEPRVLHAAVRHVIDAK